MTNIKDIVSSLYNNYMAACNLAGIKPLTDFEYNIATGCGDDYITQLEDTNNKTCLELADQIVSIISRV